MNANRPLNSTAGRISDAIGIPNDPQALASPPAVVDTPPIPSTGVDDQSILDDFAAARDTTHSAIAKAQLALDGAMDLAHTSESPRAYEVVATLIGTINDVSKTLLELQERKKKLLQPLPGRATERMGHVGHMTNNVMFAGSARDLFELMRSQGIGNGARRRATIQDDEVLDDVDNRSLPG